jgi:hypothetical protein
MLTQRIVGAFTFRKGVYSEVANDVTFTQTAWLIVIIIQLLNQMGARSALLENGGVFRWLIGWVIGAAFGIAGFAITAFLIPLVARELFKANVSFEQMVRALGLAHVWQIVGFIGILGAIPFLACLLAPIALVAGLAGLAAYLVCIKETSGMDWAGTIVTVIVAAVVQLIMVLISGGFLALVGIGVAALGQ